MQTIDASRGQWEKIYNKLDFPPMTYNSHYKGPCPICGKHNHFRIDDRSSDGDWICTCGSGKGISLIQEVLQLDFADACKVVDEIIGNNQNININSPGFKSKEDLENEKYLGYSYLQNTDAEKYLKNRGIHIFPNNDSLRYSHNYEYDHTKGLYFPSMVAKVLSHAGTYSYTHMTFIFKGEKIGLDPARKIYSIGSGSKGAAIRLFNYKKVLGVAEGIESAMSASQTYDIPVWSTLNTQLMKKFVCPKGVKHFIIFADNDKNLSGQAAAFECARRNMLVKNDIEYITIIFPKMIGYDFNDCIMQNNYEIIKQKFRKND
tara:strand:+ start:12475 stop:13428 length:954 start_codon:yes stop_codon:yes gene_type:complete